MMITVAMFYRQWLLSWQIQCDICSV